MAAEPSPLPGTRIFPPTPSETPLSVSTSVNAVTPTPVWNKLSNDAACHVIANEDSWPALSESTRYPSKSAADHPPPPPVSTSQGHLILNPKKNKNHNRNPNHSNSDQIHKPTTPSRHRSKRGGGTGGTPSQNGLSHHPRPPSLSRPPPPPPVLTPPPYPIYEGPFRPLPPPPMPVFIPPPFNGNSWDRRPINEQSFHRNPNPRGNYFFPRHENNRDRNGSHKGFVRSQAPPPPPLPFYPMPPSMKPFPDSIGFDMAGQYVNYPPPPPEIYMHFPPPMPMVVPPMDPALPSQLMKQINHYFSDDNLAKDSYLRARMNDEGWVDIAFIAAFPMVQKMTHNLQLILDSLKDSKVIEVQGNQIRRRNDWRKWIMSVPRSSTSSDSPTLAGSAQNILVNSMENVTLENENVSVNVVSNDGEVVTSSNVGDSDVAN